SLSLKGYKLQKKEVKLCYFQGNYTFTVGYHELLGKKVILKKPLLVLRKGSINEDASPNSQPTLDIIGIIRHRILFKTRPKALISILICFFIHAEPVTKGAS
ncbi:putative uncharacterized protein DDB_G0287975, partial [Amborella trichopoda]|uniref:putative uncharacterized protein DDB_G0287975 n=1 Tax=Amborella trichopoda TaxID=13333 RepID=UPI0009BF62ED